MASNGKELTLYLVCDISGSMGENGKPMLLRGMMRAVEQYVRLGYATCSIKLILWETTAAFCDWNPDDEFPEQVFECKGISNAETLCNLFDALDNAKILLFTDGWWSRADAQLLKKWKRTLPSDTLRIIKIGGDANPLLKGQDVFLTDDLLVALDGWLPIPDTSDISGDGDEW